MGNYTDETKLIFDNNLSSARWKTRRIRTAFNKRLRRVNTPSRNRGRIQH
ncbi:hypothetical protein H8S77_23685 [Parabacteroides sp. BX2]|uniref:Uncharacterized protein n=1 Tax=Parabacteroides segnis TaxID=2763058 RepID=A0ABR7E7Y5_9BACT|nr:hypothetical protein [Parabacteroides segnis]MBC5645881.1 hypothetical protein [Parabacteroides segnis]